MQVAEILSDLNSLRVCDYDEALRLVNAHKATLKPLDIAHRERISAPRQTLPHAEGNQLSKTAQDLLRAKELVQLHHEVKSRHANGEVDDALRRAREDVEHILRVIV